MAKLDLLRGYGIAFAAVASVQALVTTAVAFGPLGLDAVGSIALIAFLAVVNAVLGMALGLFCSAFAQTEFQAVQFMPVVVIPQILLCGLFVPRESLPDVLSAASDVLPLSYAVDAMTHLTRGTAVSDVVVDLLVVTAFAVAALGLGAATLRRRTP